MKKSTIIVLLFLSISFNSCVTLKDPTVIRKGNIDDYQYVIINSSKTLISTTGGTVNGVYYSESKSVNPGDVISGYLAKKGFIILTDLDSSLVDKTLIVNYGESGRRNVALGYTTEVIIQFITSDTKQLMFLCIAEGIGSTEADDIKKAIYRALSALFEN